MLWHPELDRPRLRPVEPVAIPQGEQPLVLLRDPAGIADDGVVVPVALFHVLTLMTGELDIEGICAFAREHLRIEIGGETLRDVVLKLDEATLLETATYRRRREALIDEFRAQPARPMSHAGGAYPSDPERFIAAFGKHCGAEGGPGAPPGPRDGTPVRALVAPHIDFERGAANYGWAHRALAESEPPETVVILGTCHMPCRWPITLTRLPFATPLGDLPVDGDFIDALERALPYDLFEDELHHAREHTVEFQAVALRHSLRDVADLRIVPILCGSMHAAVENRGMDRRSLLEKTMTALAETIAQSPRRIVVIASADLAHVGPQFGDPEPLSDETLAEVRRLDEEALSQAAALDADGFLASFYPTQNARRVCSVACIYTALRCLDALGASEGRVLNYTQSVDPSRQLAVTHASVVFT